MAQTLHKDYMSTETIFSWSLVWPLKIGCTAHSHMYILNKLTLH